METRTPESGDGELARVQAEIDAFDTMMWSRLGITGSGDGWLAFTIYGARFADYDEHSDRYCEVLAAGRGS
jgi:hypothetical protein